MNIVLLDSYTLNPGDLSWGPLETLGEFIRYERTKPTDIIERAKDAEIILTNKTVITKEIISSLKKLRYIGVLATGYNVIDVDAARAAGVIVTNVPAYSTDSVAQTVFAHVLAHCQHVGDHDKAVHQGRWSDCKDFSYWDYPLIELADLTLGIVGLGHIGRAVGRIGYAFGMRVTAFNRSELNDVPPYITMTSLAEIFNDSDIISINCALTAETEKMVSRKLIAQMKPSARIFNASRGGIIDEQGLADALNQGQIAGAGLDVLSTEPPSADNPLLTAKNCTITPHIAWATKAARGRCLRAVADNIAAFIDGKPANVVNR
ncbi:MAG: D-2-hydroxyacid dehydrogenase [Phycisphaerae bacterium]|nr:D-2-hydroxyacid dehydrogenase [Phycisphaerae bacterium]